jgi:hypothetical protein
MSRLVSLQDQRLPGFAEDVAHRPCMRGWYTRIAIKWNDRPGTTKGLTGFFVDILIPRLADLIAGEDS